jgi:hypothetical protein
MCRAWRKRSCSSSVHLSRGRVIVYGFRSFLYLPAAGDGAGGTLTPLVIAAIVSPSLVLSLSLAGAELRISLTQ